MIVKTRAIVFSTVKYAEADLIATCYTESDGIKNYMLQNILKSKKSAVKPSFFQPLTQLEIVANHKNKGTLEYLKEVRISSPYKSLHTDVHKATLAVFLAEILKSSIREEQANSDLFGYLKNALDFLDSTDKISNFHIRFLLDLSQFLGFYPDADQDQWTVFNLMEGKFEISKSDMYSMEGEVVENLKSFFNKNFDDVSSIKLTRTERNNLLGLIISYFQLHVQGFKNPKSLPVLQQIFK
ncbi:MAG TPA: DNA repair protein RecO [Flavobacteriaceae bacterium]|nr:DNA repair protein RecO [Flavobacteriaceae bacterium]